MYDRFGFPGLFAAYNAGPGRYEEHLRDGRPLPKETVSYLEQLDEAGVSAADMDEFTGESNAPQDRNAPSGRSLFFLRNGVPEVRPNGGILVPLGSERTDAKRLERR